MTSEEFLRLANNFYNSKGLVADLPRIQLDADFTNYLNLNSKVVADKKKVAFVFICLNPLYWQYIAEMVQGAKQFFLPGHNTDFFFWTDLPNTTEETRTKISNAFKERGLNLGDLNVVQSINNIVASLDSIRNIEGINIIPTQSVDWPYPTLLRYNLFLQQEDKLKDYEYIFYCDIDMKFVNVVGDEILGNGLTAAQHPMYAVRKQYWPPYEPNTDSASFIKRPGKVITDEGKPRFMPLYYAGGFQGGKSKDFIKAMKKCREIIDKDLQKGYIPIWNDESAWNKYLSEHEPEIVLSPSYIYPDSLIKEYYEPLWGCSYPPKLITITKWFSISKEGGQAVQQMIRK